MSGPAWEQQQRVSDHEAAFAADATPDAPADTPLEDRAELALPALASGNATPLPEGIPHVAVQFAGVRCLLPLTELRSVLTESPKLVRFPFTPPWLLGVFLHRTELLALIDPCPVLFGRIRYAADDAVPRPPYTRDGGAHAPSVGDRSTILVGSGERTLGFRVDGVSEVTFVSDGRGARPTATPGAPHEPVEARYVAALWAPDPAGPALPILAVVPLLDDLLGLLAEEGRDG